MFFLLLLLISFFIIANGPLTKLINNLVSGVVHESRKSSACR